MEVEVFDFKVIIKEQGKLLLKSKLECSRRRYHLCRTRGWHVKMAEAYQNYQNLKKEFHSKYGSY